MKVVIAKIVCFLTVLLMSSNLVFSSISESNSNTIIQLKKKTKEELQYSDALSIPILSFVLEKDPYEESDFFEDLSFDFTFSHAALFSQERSNDYYSYYFLVGSKIPLWLLICCIKI
jgi:hypothetical protein